MRILARGLLVATCGLIAGQFAFGPVQADRKNQRTIAFYSIHTKETLSIVYKRNGQYQPEALKRINWILRDWRQNAAIKIDPKLIDLAWEIHTELGSRMPIHVISAYRSPKTNAMLRRTRGGQARRSQHLLGRAMDVRFPDVPVRRLRYSALVRERGGVGYYPTSATPFVHLDTGRVRHWPRMGRYELALLFPNGRTRHRPRTGGPITRDDVRVARARYRETATRIAAFHRARRGGQPQTVIAAATAPSIGPFQTSITRSIRPPEPVPAARPPRLVSAPRLVDRSSRLVPGPSQADRRALTQIAAFAATPPGQAGRSPAPPLTAPATGAAAPLRAGIPSGPAGISSEDAGWVRAPEFDEEHPEELSYRPFPIAPFLTTTASPHDPALAQLVHPDASRTLELLDDNGSVPPLRLRPGAPMAQMLWAQAFSGKAVELSTLYRDPPPKRFGRKPPARPLANRRVTTTR